MADSDHPTGPADASLAPARKRVGPPELFGAMGVGAGLISVQLLVADAAWPAYARLFGGLCRLEFMVLFGWIGLRAAIALARRAPRRFGLVAVGALSVVGLLVVLCWPLPSG